MIEDYLDRIGVDLASLPAPDRGEGPDRCEHPARGQGPDRCGRPDCGERLGRDDVARLQRAHVTSIPFETLSVTGDPYGPYAGEMPAVDPTVALAKLTERERGGWCFELNGAFATLLDALGADIDILAARVVGDDGAARPPANHRISLVRFDGPDGAESQPHVVDVGMGSPMLREPLPLDGTPTTGPTGHTWRVVVSERPDADFATQYREPDGDEWTTRYVSRTTPREDTFFASTSEFLATAPESHFTDGPLAVIGTEAGHRKLTPETYTETRTGEVVTEREVNRASWDRLLETHFGVDLPRD